MKTTILLTLLALAGVPLATSAQQQREILRGSAVVRADDVQPTRLISRTTNELVRFDCLSINDEIEKASCSVKLRKPDDSMSEWTLANITFSAWAADGQTFVLENKYAEIFVGSARGDMAPKKVASDLTTPALSKDGLRLIAQRLGDGETWQDRLLNSPGLSILDLTTGEEQRAASPGAFAPFFVSSDLVGFGQANQAGILGLYLFDLTSGDVGRISNIGAMSEAADPFPEETPVYDAVSNSLYFPASVDGDRYVFRLALPKTSGLKGMSGSRILPIDTPRDEEFAKHANAAVEQAISSAVKFRLPFVPSNYDRVYKFYDHNGKDWAGGTLRYAGHTGTDYKLPVGTPILASAAGKPYYTFNGCPDIGSLQSTCGSSYGNQVRLKHSDGRVSIYAHLKRNSLIAQSSTVTVACGSQIAESASSGYSSDPHLHWELWQTESVGARIDPFLGPYNPTTSTGEWILQNNPYPSGLVGDTCQGGSQSGDFSILASITSTVTQGETAFYSISLKGNNGFAGSVRLQALGLPNGYDVPNTRFSNEHVNVPLNGYGYSTLAIGTNSHTSVGTFRVKIVATSGNITRETFVQIVVRPMPKPEITGFSWNTTPRANQPFSGTVRGRYFTTQSLRLFFCKTLTNTCYEHPSAGIRVNSIDRLSVSNARLGSGTWQIYVRTPAGSSGRSSNFRVN